MIDTHCHLHWDTFAGQLDEVLQRADDAGILAVVTLATEVASAVRARQIAHEYPSVWYAAGIHPNDAGNARDGDLERIAALCDDPRCVAVGEIGLDFYREHAAPEIQEEWFRAQLALAREIGKPVVIHDRKSSQRLLEVLDEEGYDGHAAPGGVFHCFAGDRTMAQEVLKRGFYISFTGNITYKNSDRPPVLREVPLDRLMLETDSPFLAPEPRRGRTNEPALIPYIAAAVASVLGVDLETVARETTRTAVKFFNLPESLLARGS